MQVKNDLAVLAAIGHIGSGGGKRGRVDQGKSMSMLATVEQYNSQFHKHLKIGGNTVIR